MVGEAGIEGHGATLFTTFDGATVPQRERFHPLILISFPVALRYTMRPRQL
jgi:hypothetical protein